MVQWGEARFRVLECQDDIKKLFKNGCTNARAHKILTEKKGLEVSLRSFQKYAAEIRKSLKDVKS